MSVVRRQRYRLAYNMHFIIAQIIYIIRQLNCCLAGFRFEYVNYDKRGNEQLV